MHRWLWCLVIALCTLPVVSVSALGETSLTDLAQYVEDDALVFASIRTDDGYLQTLDDLYQRALPFLPSNSVPPAENLTDLINFGMGQADLGTFEEDVRPWLGNSAALAFFTTDDFSTADLLFILEADGAAALEFFEPTFEQGIQDGFLERKEEDNFTIFLDEELEQAIAFGDEVVFISVLQENDAIETTFNNIVAELEGLEPEEDDSEPRDPVELMPLDDVDTPLANDDSFNSTLSDLPQDSYNIIVYSNLVEFQNVQLAALGLDSPEFEALLTSTGATAAGFTVLDGDSLTVDIVQRASNPALDAAGITSIVPRPLDFAFTNRIPDDAIAVVQSSEFGTGLQASLDNIRALSAFIQQQGGLSALVDPTNELLTDEERLILDSIDIAWFIGAINVGFSGGTGLSLENDVLPVLDGDVATYLRVIPFDDDFLPILPDMGLLFQTSDSAGAAAIVEQLGVSAENYDIKIDREAYGGNEALVLQSEEVFFSEIDALDILLGTSEDVIAFGTRSAVETALDTSNGLANDAIFQEAQTHFLPETQQLAYLAMDPVLDILDALVESGDIFVDDSFEELYKGLSILESSSVTATVSEDGLTTIRMVITLADEPRTVLSAADA